VGFGLSEHSGLKRREIAVRVAEALERVGLPGIEAMKPSEISGGMRKRVGLARAICMKPEVVLYDEPTTGLDPINADAINDLIVDLNKGLRITSVVVTHDMKSAQKIATRIAMMYEGKVRQIGRPGDVLNSHDPVVRQFVTGSARGPITDNGDKMKAERG
jgi:phospholipid/cholesterol/gamma-HCH transport system ATP-binding protein